MDIVSGKILTYVVPVALTCIAILFVLLETSKLFLDTVVCLVLEYNQDYRTDYLLELNDTDLKTETEHYVHMQNT
jgi:hypothetical protein